MGRDAGGGDARRVLVVQLRTMGDVLLCTPTVRALRRAYPGARIEFLTDRVGAEALAGNPHLDEILVWEPPLPRVLALMRELRRRRYDTAVDLQSNPRTAVLVRATGAARRVGERGRGPRNLGYNLFVPKVREGYVALKKLRMLEPLGIRPGPTPDLSLEIGIDAAQRARAQQLWEQLGLVGRQVVALSPVSREAHKQWGAERWARVADTLIDAGLQVLLTHGPGEREQAAAVAERMRHTPAWDYGRTSIRELAAIYERCLLWVGNDGGARHVAAGAGIPTVTVIRWQLSDIWVDTLPGSPHRALEKAPPQGCDLQCARCPHLGCLNAITVDEVIATVQEALGTLAPPLPSPPQKSGGTAEQGSTGAEDRWSSGAVGTRSIPQSAIRNPQSTR